VLLALLGCCCGKAAGQLEVQTKAPQTQFMFKAWSVEDGLPHLSVTALAQTSDGYIWVGTLAGLARFDGVRFKVFTPQNCPELPKSRIGGLFKGADGTLFIATERVAGLVALRAGKFEQLLGPGNEQDEIVKCLSEPSASVFVARSGALWKWNGASLAALSTNRAFYPISAASICQDGQGRIWMVSQREESGRLLRFDAGRLECVALAEDLAEAQIHALVKDASGQLWLGTSRGLATLRGDQFHPVALPESGTPLNIRELAACGDGGLWVCCADYWQRKLLAGQWIGSATRISGVQTALEVVAEDRRGNLCLGRYPEGLVIVSPQGTVTKVGPGNGLPGATVSCYLTDREGNEWLGLFDGGLVRLRSWRFSILGGSSLTTPVYSICEGHDASIWVGSSFGGVYRFQGSNTSRYGASDLPLTEVWSLLEDSHSNLWVGTSSHGVYQFRDNRFVPMFDRARISDRVDAIYEDRKGRIWFGHWGGLACYADGQLKKLPMPWFSDESEVVAITSDRHDQLWLGTRGAGLFCLCDGKFVSYTTSNGLPSNLAWSLFVDRDDTLWVGTADGGLSSWRNGHFDNFTTRDGLADETVCHIAEDTRGRLWCSSPHGAFSVEKKDLAAFAAGQLQSFSCANYDQSDGMASAACTCAFQPSGCFTKDERLLLPTLKGVAVVQTDTLEANTLPPPVLIEEVTADGKPLVLNGTTVLIAPAGRTRLEVRYTALSFSAPEKVRFKYRLQGLESSWVDGGAKRTVTYAYLPHGHYKFQVRACNNDGLWNTSGAAFELVIPRHFWQTWWFIGALLASGGAGIALTVRSLEKVKAQRKLERQHQAHLVELERARIARDFHDDIGACLTHVIVLSELVKGDKERPSEVEAYASKIGESARNAVRELRTIIWAANPRNDTLDGLVQYISQYADNFFQSTPIVCHLDLPAEVPPLPLTAEVRHNFFMVVKEALHNILKHSQASEARLSLKLQDQSLELSVTDNGRGFEPHRSSESQRSGLANMRHRLEIIGASLSVASRPGAGTTIIARWRFGPNNPPTGPVNPAEIY